jgi:APA family basic amino acid/polyamine antiporter
VSTGLFAVKAVSAAEGEDQQLIRTLSLPALTAFGIGSIIGTGIFVLTGTAAANHAGPALVVSFLLAGCAGAFAALCYAELASMIPVAGSAYSESSWPGSSAGTWCSNIPFRSLPSRSAGRRTS